MLSFAHLVLASSIFFAAPTQTPAQKETPPAIPADTDVKTTASGMKYCVLTPGKGGRLAKAGDQARVHYTGWFTDGRVFDSSRPRGQPLMVDPVGGGKVIKGWDEAIQLMSVGERIKITLPPELAYGKRGFGKDIPPDTTLIFEMELVELVATPEFHEAHADLTKTLANGLKYESIVEGNGPMGDATKTFEIKYAFWNTSKKLLDYSDKMGRTLKINMNHTPFPFFKDALPMIKTGGRMRFEVPAELCFKDKDNGADLPPNSTTIWELELVQLIQPLPMPSFALPADDKSKTTASGLKYEVIKEGSGAQVANGKTVSVHYAGWHTDGTLFDDSYTKSEPLVLRVPGGVIQGWNEGLLLMREGSQYRFSIPGELAYGKKGRGEIKPNETLIFVMEVTKVE